MNLHQLGEFGFIARRAARLQNRPGVTLGIGDDAAILTSLRMPVVTCDALVENVHFRRDWTAPFLLGRKAMNVNVSDLAAKGAKPVAAFVSLGISAELLQTEDALAWLDALYDGFEAAATEFSFTIAGGDTVRTEKEVMISVTLIGEVDEAGARNGAPFLRSGAKDGDAVLATGTLGDSAAGLFLLQHPELEVSTPAREYLLARHFDPTPRWRETAALLAASEIPTRVHAALDLSDGLAGDAAHIARASGVSIEIEAAALPLSPACREVERVARENGFEVSALDWALRGGEDYELLWCVSPPTMASLSQVVTQITNTPVTCIGRCVASGASEGTSSVWVIYPDGRREEARAAWTHF